MNIQEIKNLFPSEGSPYLNGVPYPSEKIEAIVDSFFYDKNAPKQPPENKDNAIVKILLGAPGSGKSYNAAQDYFTLPEEERRKTIYVSYDETGAIYAIPGFKEKMQSLIGYPFKEHDQIDTSVISDERYAEIENVWAQHRALSQHIRAEILKRAAAQGFNMIIDTTSSSPGTLKMIDAIRKAGYHHNNIEIEGTFAPMEEARDRVEKRPRKASYLELITKRIGDPKANKGALNMIAPLIKAAGKLTYRYNPDNKNPPQKAFIFENGVLTKSHPKIIQKILSDSNQDEAYLKQLIPMIKKNFPDFAKELEGYEDYSTQTYQSLRKFLTEQALAHNLNNRPDDLGVH